jgi:hypothetical protein
MLPELLARRSQGEISFAVLAQQRHDQRSPEDRFPVAMSSGISLHKYTDGKSKPPANHEVDEWVHAGTTSPE